MPDDPKRIRSALRQVERYREGLIRKYMKYSEQEARYGDLAYKVTCEIAHVDLVLKTARELGIVPKGWKEPLPVAGAPPPTGSDPGTAPPAAR